MTGLRLNRKVNRVWLVALCSFAVAFGIVWYTNGVIEDIDSDTIHIVSTQVIKSKTR